MSDDQNFNLLPIDVIKLMVGLYYTPIIESLIDGEKDEYKQFTMVFTYPSHTIKIQIPMPCISICGRSGLCYESKNYDAFWYILKANDFSQEEKSELSENELKIKLTPDNISIINENTTINLPNTEIVRDQILDVLYYYIEYLDHKTHMHGF